MIDEKTVALVTGANKGIGLEVVKQLGARGGIVWLGARNKAAGVEAEQGLRAQGLEVRFVQLDVTSDASVAEAASHVGEVSGRLDILVSNAGIEIDDNIPASRVSIDVVRRTLETNLIGSIRMIQAFLPLLRRSAAGRVVVVSSDLGSHTHQTNPQHPNYDLNATAYITSKAALNAITIAFAKELRNTAIKVNAANPGFCATDINRHLGILTVAQGAVPILKLATLAEDGPTGTFLGPDGPEPW